MKKGNFHSRLRSLRNQRPKTRERMLGKLLDLMASYPFDVRNVTRSLIRKHSKAS